MRFLWGYCLMRLGNKALSGAALSLAMLAGCSPFYGVGGASEVPPADAPPEVVQAAGSIYASHEATEYDEVGYAGFADFSGGEAISAAHATLPVPSYAEVTNLDTGRTILVRIADRMPARPTTLIGLSAAAARQLGVEGQARVPVRVRRTNPPQHEKIALESGRTAIERLETPPSLLNALRKKLGSDPVVAARAQVAPPPKSVAKPKPIAAPKPVGPKPTAGQDIGMPVPTAGGDRFVVEGAPVPTRTSAPTKVQTRPTASSGSYFIQVGAFSAQARAASLAKKVGAGVAQVGSVFRVRMGPYASEADARAALGGVKAKGYRDARITR
jgi:rare lipoprotein A